MKNNFRAFTTSLVGSYPRSQEILNAIEDFRNRAIDYDTFMALVIKETKRVVKIQEDAGLDIIASGELSRDNYMSFVADKVSGITMMSLEEIVEYSKEEAQEGFEESLKQRTIKGAKINNPICTGKIDTNAIFESDVIREIKKMTTKPIKSTIPSPYLLTRSLWLEELSSKAYEDREELGKDITELILNEVKRLIDIGVAVIQLDDPILAEVVFSENKKQAFYCGALSEKAKFDVELSFARDLMRPIFDYIREHGNGTMSALHVCRGNFTHDENGLLRGSYKQLSDFFWVVRPDILMLEYSTPRAGNIKDLFVNEMIKDVVNVGLGVINPRAATIESLDQIEKQVEETLKYLPAERIFLNPDCGFATFSSLPMNTEEIVYKKMKALSEASEYLRKKYRV